MIEEFEKRLSQLQDQVDDPNVLNQERIHTKIEVYEDCLRIIRESQKSAIPIVSDSDCCHPSIMYINSRWKFFCVECGQTGIESDR